MVLKPPAEAVLGQRDCPGLGHVAGGRIPAAFGHVGDHRCDQGPADGARDLVGGVVHDELVFAVHHVRTLLLGAGGSDDHGGRAGGDHVARLGPRELFQKDRIGRLAGGRGGRPRGARLLLRADRREGREQGECRTQHQSLHDARQDTSLGVSW
jgi:hypothetical protein